MTPLLAKSSNGVHLVQHLRETYDAVELLFPRGSRWSVAWTRFFRIPVDQHDRLWRTVRVSALLHDVGKANAEFQSMLAGGPQATRRQSVRHEHLSALILCLPSVRAWLTSGDVDPDVVTAAVLSHHLKAAVPGNDHRYEWCQSHGSASIQLNLQHPDFIELLQLAAECLGVKDIPPLPTQPWKNDSPPWSNAFHAGASKAEHFRRRLTKESAGAERRFLAAVKGALVAADAVSSATVREGQLMSTWLQHNAHTEDVASADIEEAILGPRAREVEARTGRAFALHNFQELAGQQCARTLLIAPCGAGKTLAAWQWAKRQAERYRFGRVIFLYPTRGTATEGFRDYVGWAPEGDATLLHGSSDFELANMSANPPDALKGKDWSKLEAEDRFFALGLWRFRYFSATVDQFLSFLQNDYRGLCLLPALADSVLILDEVHSYDRRMLALLETFLKEFDVPVLCMTATLPARRLELLTNAGLVRFPRLEHQPQLQDLEETAGFPRYEIVFEEAPDRALSDAIAAFKNGKRVLIVVNRVASCLELARAIAAQLGHAPLVYHSRFKLSDRQERHRAVVNAFKGTEPAIAVTTQVCEMSLDLDAQVLITEVAPIPSLVQRFGRANRHLADRATMAKVIVTPPAKAAPYTPQELAVAEKFVRLTLGATSQLQLAEMMDDERFKVSDAQLPDIGHFLGGGYYAVPGTFREDDDHTVQCVCDDDLSTVIALQELRKPIDGYLVPAPKQTVLELPAHSKLPPYVGLVPGTKYSPILGLQD